MKFLITLILLALVSISNAETYKGIGALDSLGEVKARFPNAKVEKMNPGWVKSNEAIYRFNGEGMAGNIIVKFNDYREQFRTEAQDIADKDPIMADRLRRLSLRSDDDALTIEWVRWVPENPVPLERLISKYGKPEESGFSSEDYQPYRNWVKKGLMTYLSNDEKYVVRIDFYFTNQDYRDAYESHDIPIPKRLMEDENQTKDKKSKKTN